MGDKQPDSSGSNAGVVILIVVLLLGLPCVGGLVLLGAGVFYASVSPRPAPPPAPQVQLVPPTMQPAPTFELPPTTFPSEDAPPPAAPDSSTTIEDSSPE